MTQDRVSANGGQETLTEGAIKAGDGQYFFDLDEVAKIDAGPDYSSAHGGVIEGDRTQAGLMCMPAGTEAGLHTHPNEQFIYLIQGSVEFTVEDQTRTVSEGELIFVPAEARHASKVLGDEDVYFFTTKDLSHGIAGTPVDDG